MNKKSWKTDWSLLRNHLLPAFGELRMDAISREAISELIQARLQAGAAVGSANRLIILLRHLFNLAVRWKTPGITENPACAVPLLKDRCTKECFLSEEQVEQLVLALEQSDSLMLKPIVLFLLLTGARRNEVLHARWEDVDLERRLWRIPGPKSLPVRHVPLSIGAIEVLEEVPRYADTPWIFANPKTRRPYRQIYYSWDTARKRAGLHDVRLHDLRHSYASFLVNSGRSIYEVQKLLGHTQIKTTQRYAHLAPETLLEATDSVTTMLSDALSSIKRKPALGAGQLK